MDRFWSMLNVVLIFVGLFVAVGCDRSQPPTTTPQSTSPPQVRATPKLDEVEDALQLSANYLVSVVDEEGKFEYLVQANPQLIPRQDYNILRHAGTIYAMCDYYQENPSPELLDAIKRAGRWLQKNCLRSFPDPAVNITDAPEQLIAVWSLPGYSTMSKNPEVKLGGCGLGLVALMSIEEIEPGFTPPQQLAGIGRTIASWQREDGSFPSKYELVRNDFDPEDFSLYYPGEAALGLVMLQEQHPNELWLSTASKTLGHLADTRRGKTDVPADHWALIATGRLLALQAELPVKREDLVAHGKQVCEVILKSQVLSSDEPELIGGFLDGGRTAPTATRLEGLLAALSFIPEEDRIRQPLVEAAQLGVLFLMRSQIKTGEFAGGIPGQIPTATQTGPPTTEIRIDYVQHAMSAMLKYLRMTRESPAG